MTTCLQVPGVATHTTRIATRWQPSTNICIIFHLIGRCWWRTCTSWLLTAQWWCCSAWCVSSTARASPSFPQSRQLSRTDKSSLFSSTGVCSSAHQTFSKIYHEGHYRLHLSLPSAYLKVADMFERLQASAGARGEWGGCHESVLHLPGGADQAQGDGWDSDQQETYLLEF